jgi:uncharacterized protein
LPHLKGPNVIAINVAQLLKAPTGATRDFAFSEMLPELTDVELSAPVQGRAHLMRTSRGILAASTYRTTVRQSCGRCLEPADTEVEGSSSDEFLPSVDVVTGHPLDERAESDELMIDQRHVLDLTEVIRQDLLTRLPLQPLCEASCPGLCAECGQELRRGSCTCRESGDVDSPFAGLAKLLRREGSNDLTPG